MLKNCVINTIPVIRNHFHLSSFVIALFVEGRKGEPVWLTKITGLNRKVGEGGKCKKRYAGLQNTCKSGSLRKQIQK